jgi:hypothetical protein
MLIPSAGPLDIRVGGNRALVASRLHYIPATSADEATHVTPKDLCFLTTTETLGGD